MLWKRNELFFIALFFLSFATPIQAAPAENTLVYIVCKIGQQTVSKGTGSIVSGDGRVLTAKHVVPPGSECFGSVGTAAVVPTRRLIPVPVTAAVDAMLLRIVRTGSEKFPFLKVCNLTDSHKRMQIVASGFPDGGTGEVSSRGGVISTVQPDANGLIETDGLTAPGMSGGPVTLSEHETLFGIVAGARFSAKTGAPIAYGVLTSEAFPNDFNLKSAGVCGENKAEFRVLYFRKHEDAGKVEELLRAGSIEFETKLGTNSLPTNYIYCTRDAPMSLVRRIALALHDGNVPIYGIERATYGESRITIESVDARGLVPMERHEIATLKACSEPLPTQIRITNSCNRTVYVSVGYVGPAGDLWKRTLSPLYPYGTQVVRKEWQGRSFMTRDKRFLYYAQSDPDANGRLVTWQGDRPYILTDGESAYFRSTDLKSFKIICRQ